MLDYKKVGTTNHENLKSRFQVWLPKIQVKNDIGQEKIENRYELPVLVKHDGRVEWLRTGTISDDDTDGLRLDTAATA